MGDWLCIMKKVGVIMNWGDLWFIQIEAGAGMVCFMNEAGQIRLDWKPPTRGLPLLRAENNIGKYDIK